MTDRPAFKRGFDGVMMLYLHDEAPRLGCGWRRFHVHVGNRKVTMTDPVTHRRARITREVFNVIVEGRL